MISGYYFNMNENEKQESGTLEGCSFCGINSGVLVKSEREGQRACICEMCAFLVLMRLKKDREEVKNNDK